MLNRALRIGWIELVIALLMGAPVRLRDGRTIQLYKLPEREERILDPSLFGFDFSKWQGAINFAQVFAYGAKFIILRCAYAITRDERFLEYINECLQYFPNVTSVYHYYDPRFHPIAQADEVIEILNSYKGRIKRVWGDFEFYWSGSYEASSYWKVYAERIIAAGYEFGIYTRKTWWDSRVGTLASWFGQFPLWAAQYSSALNLIPAGWTKADLWQKGTPAIGAEVGTESLEVDYNIADDGFYKNEYGEVQPPPPGGSMKNYRVVWPNGVSRRTAPTTSNSSTSLSPYTLGMVVDVLQDNIPDQTYPTDINRRWVKFADGYYGASDYPDSTGKPQARMVDVTPTEPPPPTTLPDLPFRFEIGDDILYTKQVIDGILKPK